jgi:hypothetical protein
MTRRKDYGLEVFILLYLLLVLSLELAGNPRDPAIDIKAEMDYLTFPDSVSRYSNHSNQIVNN